MLKRSSIRVANVTELFPDCNSTLLLLEKQRPLFDFSKGGTSYVVEVRQHNGGIYYGRILRNREGNFYLTVAQDSVADNIYIPLGKFTGTLNIPKQNTIDVPHTTLNVVVIVALMLCLLGFGIMLSTERSKRTDDTEYLFVSVYVSTCLLLLYVGFWLFDGPSFFGKRYDYPEWIAIAWLLSEIGLVGGILCKMKVDDKPAATPQKTDTDQNNIK